MNGEQRISPIRQLIGAVEAFTQNALTPMQGRLLKNTGVIQRDRDFGFDGWKLTASLAELGAYLDKTPDETRRVCRWNGIPIFFDDRGNEIVEITPFTKAPDQESSGIIGMKHYAVSVQAYRRQRKNMKPTPRS